MSEFVDIKSSSIQIAQIRKITMLEESGYSTKLQFTYVDGTKDEFEFVIGEDNYDQKDINNMCKYIMDQIRDWRKRQNQEQGIKQCQNL